MNASAVLETLRTRGVKLFVDGQRLRYQATAGAYSQELRQLVAEHRPSLIEALKASTADEELEPWNQAEAERLLAELRFEVERIKTDFGGRLPGSLAKLLP